MIDTDFDVPDEKRSRLAKLYENAPDGGSAKSRSRPMAPTPKKAKILSGGGGLFSTAGDYTRFAQMLLNGGNLDGKQSSDADRRIDDRQQSDLSAERHSSGKSGRRFWFGWIGPARRPEGEHPRISRSIWLERRGHDHLQYRSERENGGVAIVQHLPFNQHNIFAKFNTLFYASIIE